MRLSEAIRLGSMLHPQHFGCSFEYEGSEVLASCAIGAAIQAGFTMSVADKFLDNTPVCCPACSGPRLRSVRDIIAHLNDRHRWTRERIADWVEALEPPETPPAIERTPDEEFAWVQTTNAARAD